MSTKPKPATSDTETCYRIMNRFHPVLVAEIEKIMQEPDTDKRRTAVSLIWGAARYLADPKRRKG